MAWFKVDDQLAFHPKVLTAGNNAMGLWVRAGAWSSAQLTDGYIPASVLPVLGAKRSDAERLVTAGLWCKTTNGYQFHQWEERNPRRSEVEEARSSRSVAATLANHKRWHIERHKIDPTCPHCTDQTTDPGTDQ